MFNHARFKAVFEDSGLTKSELAELYGVSRQTIYDWYTQDSAPAQKTLVAKENAYTTGLFNALSKGVLPIRTGRDSKLRKERIQAMAKALHALTTPK